MFACRYAILRFLPYVETGEFANVGIVLTCESNRYFGFRLLDRRVARITRFFELSDTKSLRAGLRAVAEELERIQQTAHREKFDAAFAELVRPRETVFRFDAPRALMTADPERALNDLFARYVEHDFDARVPYEVIMERDLHQLLAQARLEKQFMAKEIGDDDFQVRFPFVREQPAGVRIIKPLHLLHTEQVRAIEHGLLWAG
jgi:Protein of unknown function (DUF3037)